MDKITLFDLILYAVVALLPAFIAKNKGRSFFLWWLYGLAIFLVAVIHVIFISRTKDNKEKRLSKDGYCKCSYCAEMIKKEATICRYCNWDVIEIY